MFVVRGQGTQLDLLQMEMAMLVADGDGLCSSKNEMHERDIAVQSSAALNSNNAIDSHTHIARRRD